MTRGAGVMLAAIVLSMAAFGYASHQAEQTRQAGIERSLLRLSALAADQPVYYTGSHSGTSGTFEQGKADAQTYADYLSYDMEHAPFDVKSSRAMGGASTIRPGSLVVRLHTPRRFCPAAASQAPLGEKAACSIRFPRSSKNWR